MKLGFRWYGKNNDSISLKDIRQIPGTTGIVWSLHDVAAGELWDELRIQQETEYIKEAGFSPEVVESVNVHEDIKLGLPSRDRYIENYQETIRRLQKVGVTTICYNFMPVFDWTRTDVYKQTPDGSTALFYEKSVIDTINPQELIASIAEGSGSFTMPGWEPERLSNIETSLKAYTHVNEEILWKNLRYFLEAIIPVAEQCNIHMAIHPDDPPWNIFGLPRIINCRDNIARFLQLVDNPYNGLTLCSGSLGASKKNDIPALITEFGNRIYFGHIRNVKVFDNGDFIETSHRSCDGSVDICKVVQAYHDIHFKGYVRPDHGRHLWNEDAHCRPGYGLYDRALGAMYIWGIWDTLQKIK